jgi:hypothetical protein
VHKVDRHELDSPETPIDAANKFVDCRPQVLILFDILTRWDSELNKDNLGTASEHSNIRRSVIRSYLSDPLGMLRQEKFESMKLLRNTLDIVQAIDADNDLDTTEALLELCDSILNTLLFQVLS